MDWLRENLRALLDFSPSQRRAIVFTLLSIVLIQSALFLWRQKTDQRDTQIIYTYLDSEELLKEEAEVSTGRPAFSFRNFDPNTIHKNELIAFGMPSYLAERIEKYRLAGGTFREKEDLKKIYGMKPELYTAMEKYIFIARTERNAPEVKKTITRHQSSFIIDLNNTDTTQLKSLRGIGPKLSSRILSYRSALGFFVSKEQLKEVWGISDSLYQTIENRIADPYVADSLKLNINEVDKIALKKHPYFRKGKLAAAIINYREQHGRYASIRDLLKIHLINDSIFHRIEHYICVDGHQQEIDQ